MADWNRLLNFADAANTGFGAGCMAARQYCGIGLFWARKLSDDTGTHLIGANVDADVHFERRICYARVFIFHMKSHFNQPNNSCDFDIHGTNQTLTPRSKPTAWIASKYRRSSSG